MTLTVLNVAYPLAPVTPETVGGAEQVLAAIDEALVEHGATSLVVACDGSRPRGTLLPLRMPSGLLDDAACGPARQGCAAAIREALDRLPIDVVHMHGVDFHHYLPPVGVPVLATLHLDPSWYPSHAIAPSRPDTFINCVSGWQHRACKATPALLPVIGNGVRIPATPPRPMRERAAMVASLGRICPEKGFHIALDVARAAKVRMTVAGQVFPYTVHVRYFDEEIRPRLSAERIFIGPLGRTQKQALLAEARCVLVTSLVPETSSLVAMEALAAGTPVVAFGKGALVEVIEHGVTGFLVRDAREMADAIAAAGDLDPNACRQAAVERFSVTAMTRQYMERYELLARRNAAAPIEVSPARIRSIAIDRRRSVGRSLEVSEVRDAVALGALGAEWHQLCAAARATPFQRPEWIIPWWHHFGAGSLKVAAVRRGRELLGVAPLYVRPGDAGKRELAFIGTGNTDYVDVVTVEETREQVADTIVDWIAASSEEWDSCELGPVRSTSAIFRARPPIGWEVSRSMWDICPVLVKGRSPNLVSAVPEGLVSRLRNEERRLAKKRAVSLERADAANAVPLFDELCALHEARWRARGRRGVLAEEQTRHFHKDVVRGMAAAGVLRLCVMRIDGRPAGALYGFAEHHRWYCYLGGFHPDFHRHSVGALVILHALEEASASGALAFDFLRGREAYKYEWGAVDQTVDGWRLAPCVEWSANSPEGAADPLEQRRHCRAAS